MTSRVSARSQWPLASRVSSASTRAAVPSGSGRSARVSMRLEVGDVLLADLRELLLAVVALVGQADAALDHVDDVAVGVAGVGVDVGPEQAAAAAALEGAEEGGEPGEVGERVDLLEQREDRGVPELLDALLVHEAGEQVADLAGLVGALGGVALELAGGRGLDDLADVLLGGVGEHHERPPRGAVAGDLRGVQPGAVDVAEEVVLDADVGVHALAGVVEDRHPRKSTCGRHARSRPGRHSI